MRKTLQLSIVALLLLIYGENLYGQNIDFTIRFNENISQYEVYAKPDFDDSSFFVGGGSQISLVLPQDVLGNVPIPITTINGGLWTDNSRIEAPAADPTNDFHGIASNGSEISFVNGQELLLFTFALPQGACLPGIRLFENETDPQSTDDGMNGGDFNNYFANVFSFTDVYRSNYNNDENPCPGSQHPPSVTPTTIVVNQDSTQTTCFPIIDQNPGDTFTTGFCPSFPANGNITVIDNELCVSYTPTPGFFGFDQICATVCDQTGLCTDIIIPIEVIEVIVELCQGDDTSGDSDGDGICDDIDNCIDQPNSDQADCDNDGIGDVCELDTDGDGIPNACDTCDGDDSDEDGVPDNCDLCEGNDASGDTDNDGVCDDIDNCISQINLTQSDCDNDGVGDICEPDDDNDGIPNDCDLCQGNDATGDDDNDGICNDVEACTAYEVVLSNDGTECVQPFTDVNLVATIVGNNVNPNDFTYSWSGENNFISSMQNPILPNIENDDSGTYTVTVTNTIYNCTNIVSTVVDVTVIPLQPQIAASAEMVCIGSDLKLSIPVYSGTDVDYEWMGPKGSSSSGAYPNSSEISINNFETADVGAYQVTVVVDECSSIIAESKNVELQNIQATPEIFGGGLLCENEPIIFETEVEADEYFWTGPNGFSSDLRTPFITNSAGIEHDGLYTLTVMINGCSSPIGETELHIREAPDTPILELAANICDGEDIVLSIVNPGNASYQWIAPSVSPNSSFGNLDAPGNAVWTSASTTNISLTDHPEFYEEGTWRVQAVNNSGCVSEVSLPLTINIRNTPQTPIASNEGNVCENFAVHLHANYEPEATYKWFNGDPAGAPAGQLIATEKDPVIYGLTPGAHQFFVETELYGCTSPELGMTEVVVTEKPVIQSVSNAGPFCEGSIIELESSEVIGANYFWIGPNGYASNEQNPIIPNASIDHAGTYILFVEVNGCPSVTRTTQVTVMERPVLSEVSHNGPICAGENLQLNGAPPPSGSLVSYEWTGPNGFTSSLENPVIPNTTSDFSGEYILVMYIDGCPTLPLATEVVNIVDLPEIPGVTSNSTLNNPICSGETIQLNTPFIDGVSYMWTGPNGFTSNLHNPVIPDASTLNVGVYRLVLFSGNCISEIAIAPVFVNPNVDVPIAINNGPLCEGNDLLLSVANPDLNATYEWFDSTGNISIGTGTDLLFEETKEELSGTYYVIATVNDCTSNPAQATNTGEDAFSQVIVESTSTAMAYVGDPLFACENSITINAVPINNGTGEWTLINGGSNTTIIQATEASTLVTDLQEGMNEFVWSVRSDACGEISTDTLLVEWSSAPLAEDDIFEIEYNESLNINVLMNDQINSEDYELSILEDVDHGSLVLLDDGLLVYWPDQGFVGTATFVYEVCHRYCENLCDEGIVIIRVATTVECEAASVMTPNGDGYNDTFIIPCVLNHPGSRLSVFNRWGDEVYLNTDYQNNWDGTYKDKGLPSGTYFYTLELNDAEETKMSGYIYIER